MIAGKTFIEYEVSFVSCEIASSTTRSSIYPIGGGVVGLKMKSAVVEDFDSYSQPYNSISDNVLQIIELR